VPSCITKTLIAASSAANRGWATTPETKTDFSSKEITQMNFKSTKLFTFIFLALISSSLFSFKTQAQTKYRLHMKDGSVVTADGASVKVKKGQEVTFRVRIENVSDKDGQVAKDGNRWPFALSPGMWVVHRNEVRLYKEGNKALSGLELQTEDGNPSGLIQYLDGHHNQMAHGVFNTPVGATAPAPILPGGAYEFTFTAAPGMRLSVITMFGQSNDWFYAPDAEGIDLFNNGKPLSGDITNMFRLYDSGTEVNEEPGVGASQAPRQKGANMGTDENGKVHKEKTSGFYGKNGELFKVTITLDEVM
jgi:hypothetical protein